MKRALILVSLALAGLLRDVAPLAAAAPAPRPSSFYGTVTVGGPPVAAGTPVSAWLGDVPFAETGTFEVDGQEVVVRVDNSDLFVSSRPTCALRWQLERWGERSRAL